MNWRYQWLWLYAFVHPKTGETKAWILPYVNTELFSKVLADFAREFELGANKHILLAVDRAGWHISQDLKIPQGLHLTSNVSGGSFPPKACAFLPPYSPELQPAERLWTLVDQPIANRSFETLDELEDVLFDRCQSLLQQQELIQGLTGFHWWTKIGA